MPKHDHYLVSWIEKRDGDKVMVTKRRERHGSAQALAQKHVKTLVTVVHVLNGKHDKVEGT